MIGIIIPLYDILQNVDVDTDIICRKIFPHTSFQGATEMFYHACLQFTVCGEEMDAIFFTGVLISSNCSRIRFLLKCHKKNVTTFCSRVFNNRSVTLKL